MCRARAGGAARRRPKKTKNKKNLPTEAARQVCDHRCALNNACAWRRALQKAGGRDRHRTEPDRTELEPTQTEPNRTPSRTEPGRTEPNRTEPREPRAIQVHDYHLLLLPQMLRNLLPSAKIGFFLHVPFPTAELMRILPFREQLLVGAWFVMPYHATPCHILRILPFRRQLLARARFVGRFSAFVSHLAFAYVFLSRISLSRTSFCLASRCASFCLNLALCFSRVCVCVCV